MDLKDQKFDFFISCSHPEIAEKWLRYWKERPVTLEALEMELKSLTEKVVSPTLEQQPIQIRRMTSEKKTAFPPVDETLDSSRILPRYFTDLLKTHGVLNIASFVKSLEELKKKKRKFEKKIFLPSQGSYIGFFFLKKAHLVPVVNEEQVKTILQNVRVGTIHNCYYLLDPSDPEIEKV